MNTLRFRWLVAATILLVLAVTPLFAQSEVSRRIIHQDDYRPTPGDVYTLVISFGINPAVGRTQESESISLILRSDYVLEVPYIGTVDASGLTYLELQQTVTRRVRERLLASFVSLTLTAPSVYDVFIWGSVARPGFHTLTSLTRLVDATAVAGGITGAGSSRRVELHRGDQVMRFDLVSYLMNGDERQNPSIRPGDRIFVPIATTGVEIRGAVVHPRSYETVGSETIGDIIALAGGLLPTAEFDRLTVRRIDEANRYTILDRSGEDPAAIAVQNGDIIVIPASTTTADTVLIEGAVHRAPATDGTPRAIPMEPMLIEVPFTPGITVLRVLEQFGGPTNFAQPERSFLIRAEDGRREPIPDLGELWERRQWDRDISLRPGDRLVVPMKRLVVAVGGEVGNPGAFAFTSGYVVRDYLELAGGVSEATGNPNRLYFAEPDGNRTRVSLDTPVPIGATIYVGRNLIAQGSFVFSRVFTVTGWVTGVMGVITTVLAFMALF